jgi:RNA polymerase sigma-70 factor (ECF subfamily)
MGRNFGHTNLVLGKRWTRVPASDDSHNLLIDEHLVLRDAQKGDRQAFAALVERYWDRLYRWLYHLTRDRHAAEDLTQEAFCKALANLNRFQAGTNFRAWLFRIAHNSFLNQVRNTSRSRQPFPEDVPATAEGPVEQAVNREALQHLAVSVAQLAPEFRAAFLLRAEEDMSFRQIAEVLGLTEETARWRVFKARQKLLQSLAPQLDREKP